jgi:uncharacterized RDD family membrane protein YckC
MTASTRDEAPLLAAASAGVEGATPDLAPPVSPLPPVAPLSRRMFSFLYEGMLLFGVLFGTGLVYALLTQQRHGLQGRSGLLVTIFLVLAAYFIGFWLHGGQTLAMKTWHVRLVGAGGRPLAPMRALARYLAAWAWFLPPAIVLSSLGLGRSGAAVALTFVLWLVGYAALALRHPRRQFLHDALCGTELVDARPATADATR